MLDESTLNNVLKSQLHARLINYDVFWFSNNSACVIIKLRGRKLSVSIPYVINQLNKDNIEVSTSEWKEDVKSTSSAVSTIVKDVRKQEVKFNKFTK